MGAGDERSRVPLLIFSGITKLSDKDCRAQRNAKTDTTIKRGRRSYPRLADKPFSAFSAVLTMIEKGASVDAACARLPVWPDPGVRIFGEYIAPLHKGLLSWIHHAAGSYVTALRNDPFYQDTYHERATSGWRLRYAPSATDRPRELRIWGRSHIYMHHDQLVRELRIPYNGTAGRRHHPAEEIGFLAYVLATGKPVADDDRDAASPQRVRVVEVGCADGTLSVICDMTPEEADDAFSSTTAPLLDRLLSPPARNVGRDCLDCKIRDDCGLLRRAPGLLDLDGHGLPPRIWSVTAGRYHADCPAKAHFRALQLPDDPSTEEPAAIRQGRAVHAWLRDLHERRPLRPCSPGDLPTEPSRWEAGGYALDGAVAEQAAEMLRHHLRVCPLLGLPPESQVRCERSVVVEDRRANILALADVDMLYQRDGSWVYRELKTTSSAHPVPGPLLLWRYPQLALAVLLFESGAIPLGSGSAIELELLAPHGPDVRLIDPSSPRIREKARSVVRKGSAAWHEDDLYPPAPDERTCGACSYRYFCPSAIGASRT
ncbi:PD-(D/E)XK nuclease family protein [Streptosporangium saharense]|uniref:PD-(D/E)XK nuclease family protein n=1 Tax=Streptosporangium saharense TaxID=1706840 RepID=UPI0036A30DD7